MLSESMGISICLEDKHGNVLETIDITVPVWDRVTGSGNNTLYHVVAFARVRLLSYQLPNQNRITARFLGLVDCRAGTPQTRRSTPTQSAAMHSVRPR